MRSAIASLVAVTFIAVVAGCGPAEVSPFVGSWSELQPSGATFLWIIEEADAGDYTARVYTDQAEWCDGQPYWSEHQPTMIDDQTMAFTGVTNQCYGQEPFDNSFYTGRLLYDAESDTMRDAADPEEWHYVRDTSLEPDDLYPSG